MTRAHQAGFGLVNAGLGWLPTQEQQQVVELKKCSICIEAMNSVEQQIFENDVCVHKFHQHCIDGWFNMDNNTCPLCRRIINQNANQVNNHINVDFEDEIFIPGARGLAEKLRILHLICQKIRTLANSNLSPGQFQHAISKKMGKVKWIPLSRPKIALYK